MRPIIDGKEEGIQGYWKGNLPQVLIALKNGAQLLKYGRKGKPKFCPFRLSRICKDKVEAEVWIAGLKALISSGQGGRSKIDGWSDGGLILNVKSPRQTCELQELEIQRSTKKPQEAMALFAEESAKCKAAKEVIKSLTVQLKDPAEKLPTGVYDAEN
ncbi:hypothetical protein glysoja_046965 [Glycine soja]|uniref:Transcription factor BREVIS RADIX N-terminal domain-containing protein n=1 Tax=Glycine soja TaxID=3848 RepID=A0A0B2SD84_GLYSO|nr:hypothetical protein glysoja_046965 [Glycine soja]